jgi:ribokinase
VLLSGHRGREKPPSACPILSDRDAPDHAGFPLGRLPEAPARGHDVPVKAAPGAVVVVGSVNADLIVQVERRPGPGETVLGGDLVVRPGGKGANQAVAAARLGAGVTFVGCVGSDAYAGLLVESLVEAGVDVRELHRVPGPSGTALITVTPDGDNSIVVSPGANARMTPDRLGGLTDLLTAARILVLQRELPPATVERAALLAGERGVRLLLNLAPPARLPATVLALCDPLVVNQHEAAVLLPRFAGVPPGRASVGPDDLTDLLALGPRSVVLTLGSHGAVAGWPEGRAQVAAPRVAAVDTTGAGDALAGALAGRLADGDVLTDAVEYAVRVGSTAVMRRGAQPSFPHPEEVLGAQ